MLSCHGVDWCTTAPSLRKLPIVLTLSLSMNAITNDRKANSSSITCLTTRSVVEANFELPHITEATVLIAIVEDSKIPPHHRSEKDVEVRPCVSNRFAYSVAP
jgi:hypothetical protein